jgi:hypothetical protein
MSFRIFKKHKKVFLIAAVVFTYLPSFSQPYKFETGVEGAFSIATLRGSEMIDQNYTGLYAFSFGMSFQFNFKKNISIRTGIASERKGATTDVTFSDSNGNIVGNGAMMNELDYLVFPLLFRLNFRGKINCFINAGPYYSTLLKAADHYVAPGVLKEGHIDYTHQFEKWDAGIAAGVGIGSFLNENKKIITTLELRYSRGLKDINASRQYVHAEAMKASSVQIMFGIAYNFGQQELQDRP